MPSRILIALVLAVLALLHVYLGLRLLPGLPVAGVAFGWALLAASFLAMPAALAAPRISRQKLAAALGWVGMIAMGLFSSLLVLSLIRDLALVLVSLWWEPGALLVERSALAVIALALLASIVGLFNARRTARVVRIDVPVTGLPPALEGFTIAQISDLHVGPTIRRVYLQRIVERVNALQADLIRALTDIHSGKARPQKPRPPRGKAAEAKAGAKPAIPTPPTEA